MATIRQLKDITIVILLSSILLFSTVLGKGSAPHDVDCTDAPDGLHEIGCWGYANCVNGKPDIHDCDVHLVFDRATMTCVQPGTTLTDCFLPVDCTGKADGSYPDYTDSCVTYYRCINEKNLGRFYCPAQTAFNENLQICDYPQNLPAPCGTKLGPAKTTTQKMMTTTKPTTVPTTQTMMTKTMPTSTPQNVMTSAQTTQKPMQTSQLQIILTSGSPKPSMQASSTQMAPITSTPKSASPAVPIIG